MRIRYSLMGVDVGNKPNRVTSSNFKARIRFMLFEKI